MTNLPVTNNFQITATYGQKGKSWANGHKGIDFVSEDKKVYATCDGVVRVVDFDGYGWGNYVTIGDNDGYIHIFCHLKSGSIAVKSGQRVDRNTLIGIMGSTGNSTGVHLHYQLNNAYGTPINPCEYLGVPNAKGNYNSKDFTIKEKNTMIFKDHNKAADWAREDIDLVTNLKLMNGVGDGYFDPKGVVTREQMAVILANLVRKGDVKK